MFTASGSQRYLLALSFSVPAPAFLVLVTPAGLGTHAVTDSPASVTVSRVSGKIFPFPFLCHSLPLH